jgi:hypothetical protein
MTGFIPQAKPWATQVFARFELSELPSILTNSLRSVPSQDDIKVVGMGNPWVLSPARPNKSWFVRYLELSVIMA